jgi:hypothetical protein
MECGEFVCSTKEGGKFFRKCFGIGYEIGNVEVQRKNINKFVLDTVTELVGRVKRRPI